MPEHEPVEPVHIRIEAGVAVLLDGAIHHQQDGGQHQDHGDDAQYHALGHDDADVPAQSQPHEAQSQKAGDGGHGAAGQGAEGGDDGGGHGVPPVLIVGKLLQVAVIEENGVVHGDAQLEHRRDGLGNVGDLAQENVGAEVVENSQANAEHQSHGQKPGVHGDAHGGHGQKGGHQYIQGHLLGDQIPGVFGEDGETGQKAVLVAQVSDLLDGFHGGFRGAGLVVLDDHHGGVAGEEDVPQVLGDHLGGELNTHHAGDPDHIADAGDLLHLLLKLVGVFGRHTLHDEHGGGGHPEGVLQKGLAPGRIQVLGQIGQNVVVDPGEGRPQNAGDQHQHGDQNDQLWPPGQLLSDFFKQVGHPLCWIEMKIFSRSAFYDSDGAKSTDRAHF